MKIRYSRTKIESTVFGPPAKGPWDPQAALELLTQVSQSLSRAGISYWVTYGSLLGLVRQNALLAWDNDVDIAVAPGVSFKTIRAALQEAGLPPRMIKRRGDPVVSLNLCKDGISADLYLLAVQQDRWVDFGGGSRGFTLTMSHPHTTVVERTFANRILPVPAEAEAYLAHLYGPQWRMPDRNWSWKHTSANRVALEFNSFRAVLKYIMSWLRWRWNGKLPPHAAETT